MPPPAKAPNKLYDQLLEFFASAIFQMPVLNFIDQNCMIFCAEDDDNPEYREVHLQYKALVSALIGAFCEDTKMKYDDFINALSDFSDRAKGFEGTALKAVYEQVLAAENYSLFVNLMLRHNVELQQQCLLLILREIGNLPPSVIAAATGASVETLQALVASASGGAVGGSGVAGRGGASSSASPSDQELAILMAVLKESSLHDSPGASSSSAPSKSSAPSSTNQKQSQPPPNAPSSTASSTGGGKSGGGLGPLPPLGGKAGGGSSGKQTDSETAEKVADFVDKMAGKRADYDKKVEQAMLSDEKPAAHGAYAASGSSTGASGGNRAAGGGGSSGTGGGGSGTGGSSLPPLPGASGQSGQSSTRLGPVSGKNAAGEEQTSLAAISAMLQPLSTDGSSNPYGDSTNALKNPATQRALEALKNMNADDLVARSEYLKAQRDRLIALKQQQRKNVLDEETKKTVASRPKSARISKQLVDDDKAPASTLSPEDEERLRIRRSIGDAIKRELMSSNDKK